MQQLINEFLQAGFYCLTYGTFFWLPLIVMSLLATKLSRILGYKTTLIIGFVGIVLHELSHALACLIVGNKITRISLFSIRRDGGVGFVEYSYVDRWYSPFTNCFVAIAPLMGGVLAVLITTHLLRPDLMATLHTLLLDVTKISDGLFFITVFSGQVFQITPGNISATVVWLFITSSILMFCIPSKTDFMNCKKAIWTLIFLLFVFQIFNPAALSVTLKSLAPYLIAFTSPLMGLAILLMLLTFFVWSISVLLARRRTNEQVCQR